MNHLRVSQGSLGLGLVLALSLAYPGASRADEAPPAGSNRSAVAQALFDEGKDLGKAGKYAAAIKKLRPSYQLEPTRGTLQALALAQEKLGKMASAYASFVKLRDESKRAGDADRLEYAKAHLAAIEPKLARVVVRIDNAPKGGVLTLDGIVLPLESLGTPLPVNSGEHRLRFLRDGVILGSARFPIQDGQIREVSLQLASPRANRPSSGAGHTPPAADGADPSERMRLIGLAAAGTGVVAIGVGSYLFVDGRAEEEDVAGACPGDSCPTSELVDRGNGARSRKFAGLATAGLGVALLGVGATIFLTHREDSEVALVTSPRWVGVRGRF